MPSVKWNRFIIIRILILLCLVFLFITQTHANIIARLVKNSQTPSGVGLVAGFYTIHSWELIGKHYGDNDSNQLLGIRYHQYFAAHFTNSFRHSSYVVGVQYLLRQGDFPNKKMQWYYGYRLGLVYGYKPNEVPGANYSNILPFPMLYGGIAINQHIHLEMFNILLSAVSFNVEIDL